MERVSHLRGRTVEGKTEGLNPHGKKKLFKFPEGMTYPPSVLLSVCLSAVRRQQWQAEERWAVAELSVPGSALCSKGSSLFLLLLQPHANASSKALLHRQLLRRCPVSWNDPLTFLPLLVSKQ